MAANYSYASPSADAAAAHLIYNGNISNLIAQYLNGVTAWQVILSLFLGLVLYDQGMYIYAAVRAVLVHN